MENKEKNLNEETKVDGLVSLDNDNYEDYDAEPEESSGTLFKVVAGIGIIGGLAGLAYKYKKSKDSNGITKAEERMIKKLEDKGFIVTSSNEIFDDGDDNVKEFEGPIVDDDETDEEK